MTDTDTKEPVAVDFNEGPTEESLQITLDDKAKKRAAAAARAKERVENRAAYEKLGIQVLRLKRDTYRLLKKEIEDLGIKTIGHCDIIIGKEKAEDVIYKLDAIAQEWDESGEVVDPQVRVALQSLKLDCIKVLVDCGAKHLMAERQPSGDPSKGNIQLPFEAGMPVAVMIGKKPDPIEDSKPQG